MVTVSSHNMPRRYHHPMRVSRVIPANIATQHGGVGLPIPLVAGCFAACKAAVHRYAGNQPKRIADRCAGGVYACGHPNLIPGRGLGKGIL